MDSKQCIICHESILETKINENICNCKVFYHEDCYDKMIEYSKFNCAICKIKTVYANNNDHDLPIDIFVPYISNAYDIFIRYPNFLTFVLFSFVGCIMTIFYIIPIFATIYFWQIIKRNHLNILRFGVIIMSSFYCYMLYDVFSHKNIIK
jgi:hypothetical protein